MALHLLLTIAIRAEPALVFDVRSYGAVGDGVTRDDAAIAKAFAACAASESAASTPGTREVRFPAPGRYLTGPWQLLCNDTVVRIEAGATVASFTTNGSTAGWPPGALDCPEPSQGLTKRSPLCWHIKAAILRSQVAAHLMLVAHPLESSAVIGCPKRKPAPTKKEPYAWRPFMSGDHPVDYPRSHFE